MGTTALNGRLALITGASSGLGAEFALQLARMGCDLVLVARRKDRLEELASRIRDREGRSVEVIAVDLLEPGAVETVAARIEQGAREVDVLVNNAGYGMYGPFIEGGWERQRDMLELDMVVLVQMTRMFVPGMVRRGFGRVLQVASVGAFQPTPLYAAYSAAKSFVLSFGVALNAELGGTGVSCTVVSPGVTATEFLDVAGQKPTFYQRMMMMQCPDVVRVGLRAMLKRRSNVVPGILNALGAWSMRLMPLPLAALVAGRTMR